MKPVVTPTPSKDVVPTYKTLPPRTKSITVQHVYDGDTLTLSDKKRVRLLGIDCPELKAKQAFAEEAKEYTKSLCARQEIWLLTDGEDSYGRLLGHVFVQRRGGGAGGGGFLCVNEGLVQQGLAYVYSPTKTERSFNWEKLLHLQREARTNKRGVWKSFQDETVFKTGNGSAYHRRSCTHLAKSRNIHELKISAALDFGLHPCRTCLAES
jgi:micrococcal nuclease